MNKSRGFTIIELIVVIAIIAVLAAIVLVNVTQYIGKGKDTAAKGDLSTILTNSTVFYGGSGNSTYNGFLTDPTYTNVTTALGLAANGAYTVTATCNGALGACDSTSTKFCAQISEKAAATNTTYCVDSSGNKLEKVSGTCALGVCS